jgi:hypothetical protein
MRKHQVVVVILTLIVLSVVLLQTACDTGLKQVSGIDSLVLEFRSNQSRARVDEQIQMGFTITNRGQNRIIIESQGTPVMDISVDVVGGEQILSWSNQNSDKVTHQIEWKPGESKVIEWIWVPKQEDIYTGAFHDVFLTGLLYKDGKIVQSAGVTVCASNYCR